MPSSLRDRAKSRPLRTADAPAYAVRPIRRRASVARYGVWVALATGPLALAVVVIQPHTTVRTVSPQHPAVASQAAEPPDPSGAAALFLDLWLRTDASQATSSTAKAVQALAPQVPLPDRHGAPVVAPLGTTTVRSAHLSGGTWSLVVAARFAVADPSPAGQPGQSGVRVRYFAIPVSSAAGASGAGAFTVTAAPAEVNGPGTVAAAPPVYSTPVSDGPLASTLGEFFSSYLKGVGPVDRYLAPGERLSPPDGDGFRTVQVDQVMANTDTAAKASVPADGSRASVQVQVTATDTAGTDWPLSYELVMAARAGRWEVAVLQAGAPAPAASPGASGTPTVGGGAR
jgi:Conjugative transposon protein TcpC